MEGNSTFRSVWAVADDYCIKAMKSNNTTSSSDKDWPTWTDQWKRTLKNDSEDDSDDSPFTSKSGQNAFCAKKNDDQGLFSVLIPKKELRSQISEDFEAIPIEFRPNKTTRNLLPVKTESKSETVRMFKYTNEDDSQQHDSAQENVVVKSKDNNDTKLKGMKWNDNLNAESSKIRQQFSCKVNNSQFDCKGAKERLKGNYAYYHKQNQSFSNDNKYNRNNLYQNQQPSTFLPEQKKPLNTEKLKHQSPSSVTVLSQVTTFSLVTPEKQVKAKQPLQRLGKSKVLVEPIQTKSEDKEITVENEVLFEHITRKTVRKKMTWMDNLCTVKGNSVANQITYECVSRYKSRYSPPQRKEIPRKKYNPSSANKYRLNKNTQSSLSSKGAFDDHTEEFIRAQYRYQPERESRKIERISMPKRQSNEEVSVIKHIVEVYHVNQPNQRTGNIGRKGKVNNYSKRESDVSHHLENKCPDLISDGNKTKSYVKGNSGTFYQHTQNKTVDAQRLFEMKSQMNYLKEETGGLFAHSQGTENYSAPSPIQKTLNESSLDSEDIKHKRSLLIRYGEEISDTIVGSYTAMNMFLSFYQEWKNLRVKAMHLLEEISNNLMSTNNRRNKTKNVFQIIGDGGRIVAAIPDMRVALPARIISVLSDFFAKLFSSSPTLKNSGINELELIKCLQQDVEATSDMNIFGLQCDQNFQETCNVIEEFHKCIQGWCFKEIAEGLDADFLEDISTLNPKRPIVYYRRLQKWLERLAENSTSDIGRAFSRGFRDFPEAMVTTNLLHWRYHSQGMEAAVSLRSWDEIRELLQNKESVAVVDVVERIQNSIFVLIKERSAMEKDVMELLPNEKQL